MSNSASFSTGAGETASPERSEISQIRSLAALVSQKNDLTKAIADLTPEAFLDDPRRDRLYPSPKTSAEEALQTLSADYSVKSGLESLLNAYPELIDPNAPWTQTFRSKKSESEIWNIEVSRILRTIPSSDEPEMRSVDEKAKRPFGAGLASLSWGLYWLLLLGLMVFFFWLGSKNQQMPLISTLILTFLFVVGVFIWPLGLRNTVLEKKKRYDQMLANKHYMETEYPPLHERYLNELQNRWNEAEQRRNAEKALFQELTSVLQDNRRKADENARDYAARLQVAEGLRAEKEAQLQSELADVQRKLAENGSLHESYYPYADRILLLLETGRADSKKEALNLLQQDLYSEALVAEQQEKNRLLREKNEEEQRANRQLEEDRQREYEQQENMRLDQMRRFQLQQQEEQRRWQEEQRIQEAQRREEQRRQEEQRREEQRRWKQEQENARRNAKTVALCGNCPYAGRCTHLGQWTTSCPKK